MNHRDTMNTARRSRNRPSLARHSRAGGFPWSVRGRPVPVPEGRRRRLAGGKFAPADAAPGNGSELLRAPAGHRRNGPECRTFAGDPIGPRRRATAETLRNHRPRKLLRCPAGARPVRRGNRGPRPLARACPRLISCGVPPGPGAKRRPHFSGGLLATRATAKSSRRARIFPGARRCARRTSRSRLAPWDASDFNGCLRAFWAAAAGPRRTPPRSLDCGSAALCPSCLCGPLGGFHCIDTP